jgi:hypothetical protein
LKTILLEHSTGALSSTLSLLHYRMQMSKKYLPPLVVKSGVQGSHNLQEIRFVVRGDVSQSDEQVDEDYEIQ